MGARKTRIAALLLGLLIGNGLRAAPGDQELPPTKDEGEVYLLDPHLPADIDQELRERILSDITEGLQEVFGGRMLLRQSKATGTMVMRSSAAVRKQATELANQLRERAVASLPQLMERYSRKHSDLNGEPLELQVQIAVASREAQSGRPLPADLAKALGKALGFQSFEVVGQAAAQAVVGEETELSTVLPYQGSRELMVKLHMVPKGDGWGRLLMRTRFEVNEVGKPEKSGDRRIQAELSTTYQPRAGRPIVIGASPLSEDRALLFLVSHQGAVLDEAGGDRGEN